MKRAKKVKKERTIYLIIAITVVTILLIASISYVMFFKKRTCGDMACFQKASVSCLRYQYINEDNVATWKYEILGKSGNDCKIRVTLVSAREGELGINRLAGEKMDCYTQGAISYPEKDLRKCHGVLKEDLLYIIINKLHSYIINNLGQLDESLKGFA